MLGVHKMNSVLYKHKTCSIPSSLCYLCTSYEEETVSHLLFRCSFFQQNRKMLWKDVEEMCPSQLLLGTINSMNDNNKCSFLLTGLNNSYVCEWTMFYHSIAKFINTMYQEDWALTWIINQWCLHNSLNNWLTISILM